MSRLPPDPINLNPSAGDPLDRDERALFAAGAQEQAPARLRAALLAQARTDMAARGRGALIEPRAYDEPQPALPARRAMPSTRRLIGLALSAAAGVLAAWSLWSVPEVAPGERLLISAEHMPAVVPSAPGVRPVSQAAVPRTAGPPAGVLESPRAAPSGPRELEAQPVPARAGRAARAAKPASAPPPAGSSDSAALGDAVPGSTPLGAVPAAVSPAAVSPAAVPPIASQPVVSQPVAADVRRELELLQSAQKALRAGQHQRVLELLDAPGSQLERGDFAAEARLMRIEALAGSGRRAEAASLAREFLQLFPHSPLADRARGFSAGAP